MSTARFSPWVAVLTLLILTASAARAGDSEPIRVVAASQDYEFGRTLHFHLEVASPAEITSVELAYGPAGQPPEALWQPPAFQPATRLVVDHVHDLTSQRFQAFGPLEYRWTVTDMRGHRLTTPVKRFLYEDNRFEWQREDGGGVTVNWYGRPREFGRTALYVAQNARTRIAEAIGRFTDQTIRVYIYSSPAELQAAVQAVGQEWVVGQAYPRASTCLVVIPEGVNSGSHELERVIPHEISHLLAAKLEARLPRWLDEGLATDNEGVHDPHSGQTLQMAAAGGRLIGLDQLCRDFPVEPQQAAIAYAQSASVVNYIRERYGTDGLRRLTAGYQGAEDCQDGLSRALRTDLAQLQSEWAASLPQAEVDWSLAVRSMAFWLALAGAGAVLVVLGLPSVPLILPWRRKPDPKQKEDQSNESRRARRHAFRRPVAEE